MCGAVAAACLLPQALASAVHGLSEMHELILDRLELDPLRRFNVRLELRFCARP